jgi:hypothetical protein
VKVRQLLNDEGARLERERDGSLWARYSLNPAGLIARGVGIGGAQDLLPDLYTRLIKLT